jgi:hypothetical protein
VVLPIVEFRICISFHWGLRKMGENPIMGQHENRGESRTSQMHLIIGRQSMRLCPSRHPSIKPDKLAMTLQLCSAIGATGTSQPWTD